MGKLLIIRHGHTALNLPGRDERLRGWLDIPLDEKGSAEAAATAEYIQQNFCIGEIFSSDLRRARQTAEILRHATRAPLTHTGDLRPWNLGVFCGQRVREVLPYLNLLNQHPDLPAPGGESFYQFYGRYSHRLYELLARAAQSSNCIVAVTHVRNLLATATIILGGDKDKVPVKGGPHTGALVVVEQLDGAWRIHDATGNLAASDPEVLAARPAIEALT